MIDLNDLKGAEYFFDEFVLPNYRDFLQDQLNVRLAYNAAVSIGHVPDHVVRRKGGHPGEVGNLRKQYRSENHAFKIVEAMSNAIKHVHATGGGGRQPIVATATGMTSAGPDYVHFVGEVDEQPREYRSNERLLIFDYSDDENSGSVLVAWTLYNALRFVAHVLDKDGEFLPTDIPNQIDLRHRLAPSASSS